ncbi:hypothetical protein C7212DRAFT_334958 [Tuber magnatum]|uniref:Uncharacterized protein n=1 Tax=Tuber magnatum TaxID=42249 RepID=A0A317SDT3_9PEZI|nr:hypothetical protein C7212DRAFT_334958 [Tuber magnatum]
MASPAPSSPNAHGPIPDTMGDSAGALSPTNPNGESHYPCPVSTNPLGFPFTGQFYVQLEIASPILETESTETFPQSSTDTIGVAASHVNEVDKVQENTANHKAILERRERYLPSYTNFLPIKPLLQAGKVPSRNPRARNRSPVRDSTNDVDGSKLEKEVATDKK